MPIITPPNDYGIPEPELIEDKPILSEEQIFWRNRRVAIFLNVPNWKCAECGATMFGRMKYCVYCKLRLGKHTPRPKGEGVEKLQVRDGQQTVSE